MTELFHESGQNLCRLEEYHGVVKHRIQQHFLLAFQTLLEKVKYDLDGHDPSENFLLTAG